MLRLKLLFSAVILLSGLSSFAQTSKAPLFVQDSLRLISSQFQFTEGPAVDGKGDVYFTDQPENKIWKYSLKNGLSLFKEQAGRSNGTYVDAKGNLVACADEQNEIWSIAPDGAVKILAKGFEGKRLNGPNDLWLDKKGGIYVTDPYYQRDYWTHTSPEIEKQRVYYLPKGGKKLLIAASDLEKPNGIVGSPDGRFMYVADIAAGRIYKYTIEKNGELTNQVLLIKQGADGITLDEDGNIYLAGNGVDIYSPEGKHLGKIKVPEKWTANLCFIGPKRDQLFITASKSVYVIPMNVRGVE